MPRKVYRYPTGAPEASQLPEASQFPATVKSCFTPVDDNQAAALIAYARAATIVFHMVKSLSQAHKQ